jgi:hypothetical protein
LSWQYLAKLMCAGFRTGFGSDSSPGAKAATPLGYATALARISAS